MTKLKIPFLVYCSVVYLAASSPARAEPSTLERLIEKNLSRNIVAGRCVPYVLDHRFEVSIAQARVAILEAEWRRVLRAYLRIDDEKPSREPKGQLTQSEAAATARLKKAGDELEAARKVLSKRLREKEERENGIPIDVGMTPEQFQREVQDKSRPQMPYRAGISPAEFMKGLKELGKVGDPDDSRGPHFKGVTLSEDGRSASIEYSPKDEPNSMIRKEIPGPILARIEYLDPDTHQFALTIGHDDGKGNLVSPFFDLIFAAEGRTGIGKPVAYGAYYSKDGMEVEFLRSLKFEMDRPADLGRAYVDELFLRKREAYPDIQCNLQTAYREALTKAEPTAPREDGSPEYLNENVGAATGP